MADTVAPEMHPATGQEPQPAMASVETTPPPAEQAQDVDLLKKLQEAVLEQEEYVKKKLAAVKPSKNLRPGKVEELKHSLLDIIPMPNNGIRDSHIRDNWKGQYNNDEYEQALSELTLMRCISKINDFYYRLRAR